MTHTHTQKLSHGLSILTSIIIIIAAIAAAIFFMTDTSREAAASATVDLKSDIAEIKQDVKDVKEGIRDLELWKERTTIAVESNSHYIELDKREK